MKLRRLGQATLGLAGGYLAALAATRRWHQHWGATDEEITKPWLVTTSSPPPDWTPLTPSPSTPGRPDLALAGPDGL